VRSLFVYWKQAPAETAAALAAVRALHRAWQAAPLGQGLQARLYQRPEPDAQGRLTCMATYHRPGGLAAAQAAEIAQALQAALPGCHLEAFDELPG
jgi:hypothetical protein